MSQTIKRSAKSARRVAVSQGNRQKVRKARAQGFSLLDTVMGWLPFSEAQLHRIFLALIVAIALAVVWVGASLAGVPAFASEHIASAAADAGFKVRRVEVRGARNINRLKVYEAALAQRDRAMTQVDLEGLRQNLLAMPWIADARVSSQLPDTLVVDIVERTPHAVLRKADGYVLIDEAGHELQAVSSRQAAGRLTVSGDGAAEQVASLDHLLEAAPALKPQVREAEWIGHRRWNLTFKTGQVLALPEGAPIAASALVSFARLDGTNRLLGGEVAAFDMRASDRIYFRVPGRETQDAAGKAAATAKRGQVAVAAVTANDPANDKED